MQFAESITITLDFLLSSGIKLYVLILFYLKSNKYRNWKLCIKYHSTHLLNYKHLNIKYLIKMST